MKARVIGFYLPQFHPTPDNDEWWGKGFTEWTNVAKAKPRFKGHYQPKIPADLGFYDLRLPQVREQQAELAREAGVEGFCYYHYWFGNGKQELELPFNEVLKSGEPDFPFCLCWANETWHGKFWNKEGNMVAKKVLVEQLYLGKEDNEKHFYHLLPAFKDKRYITVEGKPLFMIFRPYAFPGIEELVKQWNELAVKNGLKGIYFVGQTPNVSDIEKILGYGLDAVNMVRLKSHEQLSPFTKYQALFNNLILHRTNVYPYEKVVKLLIGDEERQENVFPSIVPNWDYTARSATGGYVYHDSTPEKFKEHVRDVFSRIENKDLEHRIVFIKSWNEWGEGNYMEPDLKFGKGYIRALRDVLDE